MSAIDRVRGFFDKTDVRAVTRHGAQVLLTVVAAAGIALGSATPAEARDSVKINVGPGGVKIGVHDKHFSGSVKLPAQRVHGHRNARDNYIVSLTQILPNGAENPLGTFDARSPSDCVKQTKELAAGTGTQAVGICESPRTVSETICTPKANGRGAFCNTSTRRY